MDGCADENTFVSFAEGRLVPPHLTAFREHLGRCNACTSALLEVTRRRVDAGYAAAGTVIETLSEVGSSSARVAPLPEIPPMVEEYRLVRPAGRGAVGEVYLAIDTLLDRPVALKFLAIEPRAAARERFRREARA